MGGGGGGGEVKKGKKMNDELSISFSLLAALLVAGGELVWL